jgi:hypothetical protein
MDASTRFSAAFHVPERSILAVRVVYPVAAGCVSEVNGAATAAGAGRRRVGAGALARAGLFGSARGAVADRSEAELNDCTPTSCLSHTVGKAKRRS